MKIDNIALLEDVVNARLASSDSLEPDFVSLESMTTLHHSDNLISHLTLISD